LGRDSPAEARLRAQPERADRPPQVSARAAQNLCGVHDLEEFEGDGCGKEHNFRPQQGYCGPVLRVPGYQSLPRESEPQAILQGLQHPSPAYADHQLREFIDQLVGEKSDPYPPKHPAEDRLRRLRPLAGGPTAGVVHHAA